MILRPPGSTGVRLATAGVGVLMLGLSVGCSSERPTDGSGGLQRPTSLPSSAAPGGASGSEGSQNQEAGSDSGVPNAEPLPIQHYMLVGREYDTVMRALSVLTQECMDAQGFDLTIPPPLPARGPGVDISIRRYGYPETLADAREVGYGLPAHMRPDPALMAIGREFDQRLTESEQTALTGSAIAAAGPGESRNGCIGKADRQLMGDSSVIEASGLAESQLVRDVKQDPRATDSEASRAAIQRFAECMGKVGYPEVDHPLSDRPKRFRSTDIQQPSAAEKEAAVAQIGCLEESQVREAMRAAEVSFQTAAIEANPEAFAQIRRELDDVVRRATEVLGES